MIFLHRVKNELLEWIKNSTLHGLPHIFNSEKSLFIRIVWSFLFVVSAVVCFISIIQSFQDYYEYEALIKIEIEKDTSVQFPTISLCNLNQFSNNFSTNFVKNVMLSQNVSLGTDDLNIAYSIDIIDYLSKSNLINYSDEFKRSTSFSLETMIISCLFAARPCKFEDFEWFYSNDYGNCYRYNFNEINKIIQTRSGKFYGLRLELFVDEPESLYSLSSSSGVHLFITNNSNEYLKNGFDVSTGVSTDLSMSRQSFYRLGKPFSNCISNNNYENLEFSEYSKKTFDLFKQYTKEACIDLCLQDYLEKNCGCYSIKYPSFKSNLLPCSTLRKLNCINEYTMKFFENKNNVENCEDKCPVKCDQLDFIYLATFSDYPSQAYANGLLRHKNFLNKFNNESSNLNYEKIKSRILSLNIFYSSFDLFKITEVENITLIGFISSIGGTLGLYIGISILSLFEIAEILLKIFFMLIESNTKIITVK